MLIRVPAAIASLCCALLLTLPACGDDDGPTTDDGGEVLVEATLTASDPVVGENTFDVRVLELSGDELVANATLTVDPFMPSMGHGSNEEPTITANGDGTFVVTTVVFTMGGDWEVTFRASTPEGRSGELVWSGTVDGGMDMGSGDGMDMGSGDGMDMGSGDGM